MANFFLTSSFSEVLKRRDVPYCVSLFNAL